MAKIHKATVYCIDHENSEDKESFKGELSKAIRNSYLGRAALIVDASSTKEFEWDDDIDINNINANKDTFEKYFTKDIAMSKANISLEHGALRLSNSCWRVVIAKGNDCGYDEQKESYTFSPESNLAKEIDKVKGCYDQIESIEMVFDHKYVYEED